MLNEPGGYNYKYNPPKFKGNFKESNNNCDKTQYKINKCCYNMTFCCQGFFGRIIYSFNECNCPLLAMSFCSLICILGLIYILFPIILWGIFAIIIGFIVMIPLFIFCRNEGELLWIPILIGGILGFVLFYQLWTRIICTNPSNDGGFWDNQCYVWNIVLWIFLVLVDIFTY